MKICIFLIIGFLNFILCSHQNTTDDPYPTCPVTFFRRKRALPDYTRWRANAETTPEFLVKILDDDLTTSRLSKIVAVNIQPGTKGVEKIVIGGAMVTIPASSSRTTLDALETLKDYTRFVPPTTVATRIEGDLYLAPVEPVMPGPVRGTEMFQALPPRKKIPQRDESPPASPQFIPRSVVMSMRQYAPITPVGFTRRTKVAPLTPPSFVTDSFHKSNAVFRTTPYDDIFVPTRTTPSIGEFEDLEKSEEHYVTRTTYTQQIKPERNVLKFASAADVMQIKTKTLPITEKTDINNIIYTEKKEKDKDIDAAYSLMFYNYDESDSERRPGKELTESYEDNKPSSSDQEEQYIKETEQEITVTESYVKSPDLKQTKPDISKLKSGVKEKQINEKEEKLDVKEIQSGIKYDDVIETQPDIKETEQNIKETELHAYRLTDTPGKTDISDIPDTSDISDYSDNSDKSDIFDNAEKSNELDNKTVRPRARDDLVDQAQERNEIIQDLDPPISSATVATIASSSTTHFNTTTTTTTISTPEIETQKSMKEILRDKRRKVCSMVKLRELNFNSPRTLPEIESKLKQWAEESPVAKWVDITDGNLTAMERPIYMMIVDDPSSGQIISAKQTVMIVAGIQGRDQHAVASAMYVLYQLIERSDLHADLLKKYRFWIIPVFNPDGYDYAMTFSHRREWTKNLRQHWDACKGREACHFCESYGLRCTIQPCYGVNLDRNFEYQWIPAEELRAEHPCGSLYAGTRQLSEAETNAFTIFMRNQHRPIYIFIAFKEGDVLGVMYPYSHTKKKRAMENIYKDRASRAAGAAYSIMGRPYVAGQTSQFLPLYAGGIEDWVDGHLGVDNTYSIMMFRPSDTYNARIITERVVHEAYAAMDTLVLHSSDQSRIPPVIITATKYSSAADLTVPTTTVVILLAFVSMHTYFT